MVQSTLCDIKRDIQSNGIELNPEINSYIYDQLIFYKGFQDNSLGEIIIFSTNRDNWIVYAKD